MNDGRSELPLAAGATAPAAASKDEILRIIDPVTETLGQIAGRDQRLSAKTFYQRRGFVEAAIKYWTAAFELQRDWNEKNFRSLLDEAVVFLEVLQSLFPNERSRMLTVLRRKAGPSLSILYKNSTSLIRLMERGFSDEMSLEPINVPEQEPSPIRTKVVESRIVPDSGRALQSFLRKEGISETRRYIRNELLTLSSALESSNVDRKYLEAFNKLPLLVGFEDDAGSISFGLHVRLVSQLTKKIENERSDVLIVQIAATLTHAAYFASQYKDWVEFLHNAQSYPSRRKVENEIDAALSNVADVLEGNPKTVDERIPESVRLIPNPIAQNPLAQSRSAMDMMRQG
jgi:hypothetical protein